MSKLILYFLCVSFISTAVYASELDIYNVDKSLLNDFSVIKKGTVVNLNLADEVRAQNKSEYKYLEFQENDGKNLQSFGMITKTNKGGRFSNHGTLELSTNKLVLEDGRTVNFFARSPLFQAVHRPHIGSGAVNLGRTITALSISATPVTFGASLGIGFIANGLLSVKQNGPSDFVWGGLDGIGLSAVESVLRKQPDVHLKKGTTIPFILTKDLKISNGIKKEKVDTLNVDKDTAIEKINALIKRGDLTGALEYSLKTGQKDIHQKILNMISS